MRCNIDTDSDVIRLMNKIIGLAAMDVFRWRRGRGHCRQLGVACKVSPPRRSIWQLPKKGFGCAGGRGNKGETLLTSLPLSGNIQIIHSSPITAMPFKHVPTGLESTIRVKVRGMYGHRQNNALQSRRYSLPNV